MEKPENDPPRTGKLHKLRGREEFSSLQRVHSSGSGSQSSNLPKSRVILPPMTPPAYSSAVVPVTPHKPRGRFPKPLIRGSNQPMSTLDNNRLEPSVKQSGHRFLGNESRSNDPEVFYAYEDSSFYRKIRVELARRRPLAQITINAEPKSTDKVQGTFTANDPTHFVFVHRNLPWKSFYMPKDVAHHFRVMCKQYGVVLQTSDPRRETRTRVSRPLARADTLCVLCFPEPNEMSLVGQKIHVMLNSEGFRISGTRRDGGGFYRTFDFKEYSVKLSNEWNGKKSTAGFITLERKDSRFIGELVNEKERALLVEELAKHGPSKPISKSLAARNASPTKPLEAKPEPETPSRKRGREDHVFEAQPVNDFYSSPRNIFPTQSSPKTEEEFALSKRAKSTSSPKSAAESNPFRSQVSAALRSEVDKPTSEKLESPDLLSAKTTRESEAPNPTSNATSDSISVVADMSIKPSQRTPRVRRATRAASAEFDPIIEPTQKDVDKLVERGFKPLRYVFWDGKSARLNVEDMVRLNPQIYLNDNLIWFYLKFYLEKLVANDPASAEKIMMLDTFFYPAMRSIGNGAVPSWVAKLAFDQKPIVFLPIHDSSHWALAMIVGLNESLHQRIQVKNESYELYEAVKPTVVIFDSLGPSRNSGTMRRIITALSVALKAQGHTPLTYKEYRPLKTDAPNQDNLTDCGVFVLHYVQQILAKLKLFMSRVTESQERNIALGVDFWNTDDLEKKRMQLQEELFDLSNSSSNQLSLKPDVAAAGAPCDESDDFIELVEEENCCRSKDSVTPASPKRPDEEAQKYEEKADGDNSLKDDTAIPLNSSAMESNLVSQSNTEPPTPDQRSGSSNSAKNIEARVNDSVSSVSRLSIASSDEAAS